jgi:spore photoproduct lyase
MKRHTNSNDLSIATNPNEILTSVNNHAMWLPNKEPNQTDSKYWTYDISCNEDFALHSKHHKWEYIFDFFKGHDRIKASLATKVIPVNFLSYDPEGKVRIRFSLMPQSISSVLERGTPKIIDRIKAISAFIDGGYEVHINFSPIVVYENWLEDYRELFEMINTYVDYKDEVLAECIFLTHNEKKHKDNLTKGRLGESLLWYPSIQETKTSNYGGENIRYKLGYKSKYIELFTKLHDSIIPWNKIRYIF